MSRLKKRKDTGRSHDGGELADLFEDLVPAVSEVEHDSPFEP